MPLASQRQETVEPSQVFELSAGRVSARLEPAGTALRDIAIDREVVLRGLALVARDADWGTLPLNGPPQISRRGDSIEVETAGSGLYVNGDLSWEVMFRITPSGVEARARIRSEQGFRTNRTGLVVLHGLGACRGQEVLITHPDGRTTRSHFPVQVSPHQPFRDLVAIEHTTVNTNEVRIAFEGEVFETEDQRNWTDASYKTYSRPLDLPFPYEIGAGESVEQTVRVMLTAGAVASEPAEPGPRVAARAPLPRLGTGLPVSRPSLEPGVRAALDRLGLAFVALEVDPSEEGWSEGLAVHLAAVPCAVRIDGRLGRGVEAPRFLSALKSALAGKNPAALSLWGADEAAIEAARGMFPGLPIGGGTGAFFAEFNRGSLPPGIDYAGWTTNPTVHASDDDTIGETVEPLADIVATAKAKAPGLGLAIGPITLGMRFNPNATSAEARRSEPPADPRQHTTLAAAWLLGTIAGFLDPAVTDLTAFEVSGPKGLILSDADGTLSPAGHLMARLGPLSGRPAHSVVWPGQARARGLMVHGPGGRVLAIAQAQAARARLALPEGRWTLLEELGPGGFVANARPPRDEIEIDGFGLVWIAEADGTHGP